MQKSLMTMSQTELSECACTVEPNMDIHIMYNGQFRLDEKLKCFI